MRPPTNDLITQAQILLLAMTMGGVANVPRDLAATLRELRARDVPVARVARRADGSETDTLVNVVQVTAGHGSDTLIGGGGNDSMEMNYTIYNSPAMTAWATASSPRAAMRSVGRGHRHHLEHLARQRQVAAQRRSPSSETSYSGTLWTPTIIQ